MLFLCVPLRHLVAVGEGMLGWMLGWIRHRLAGLCRLQASWASLAEFVGSAGGGAVVHWHG